MQRPLRCERGDQAVEVDAVIRGMSPSSTSAPSQPAGTALMPALSELLRPSGVVGIVDERDIEAGQRGLHPVSLMPGDDQDRPRRPLASAASTTRRTIGLPPMSASSLFAVPMRVERPAASTMQAMFGIRGNPGLC